MKKNDINVNRQCVLALRVGFGCLYLYLFFASCIYICIIFFCAVGFEIYTFVNVFCAVGFGYFLFLSLFLCGWLWLFFSSFCVTFYILSFFLAGGTDAKIIKSISERNTACPFLAGGTDAKIIKSISERNTACPLR